MSVPRTIPAAPYRNRAVPRQGAPAKGEVYPHSISQHQRGPGQAEPFQELGTPGSCHGEMRVPPGAEAEEGLSPFALSRASMAPWSSGAALFRSHGAAAVAAALCRHRDGAAEPSLALVTVTVTVTAPTGRLSAMNAPCGRERARPGPAAPTANTAPGKTGSCEWGPTSPFCRTALSLESAASRGFGEGSRNTLHFIFLGKAFVNLH